MSGVRKKLVVMKFGGTSVEDAAAIERTAAIVRGRRDKGLSAIVVVSAMSKVTDTLLACCGCGRRGRPCGCVDDQREPACTAYI